MKIELRLDEEQAKWMVEYLGTASVSPISVELYEHVKGQVHEAKKLLDIDAEDIVDWELCHLCDGNLEGGPVNIEGRIAAQDVTCLGCDTSWTELYEATRRVMHS